MDFPLGSLGLQVKAHWEKYRPQMSAQLQREGKLEESVYAAQERTSDLMDDPCWRKRKLSYDLGREE